MSPPRSGDLPVSPRNPVFPLLIACFFLSGLAGLVYQTAWSQQLTLVFGASEPAVATVLASYMAGLALGAALAARWQHRVRRPVLAYALLELAIGVSALLVPRGLELAGSLQPWLVGSGGAARVVFYFATSFGMLLVPTVFMGATLPLLVRHAVVRESEIGPRVGWLYTANTLGAAAGAVAGAFVLLPSLGLAATVWSAAALNVAVFGAAVVLQRLAPARASETTPAPAARAFSSASWVLPVMLVSGAVSFTYEVFWTRLLSQLFGGSLYAFGTMLGAFLTGLAAGAALAARFCRERATARLAFAATQIAIAFASLGAYLALPSLPGLPALGAAALLLPLTVAIGATFPLAVRVLAGAAADAAPASGRTFAWNTVGAILGAVGGGFFVLPALGFAGTVRLAVALSLLLGAAALVPPPRRPRAAGLVALLALGAAALPLTPPWALLKHTPLAEGAAPPTPGASDVAFFAVGRSANVLLLDHGLQWRLSTNGLPESLISRPGSRPAELLVARWMALLPGALRSEARRWLVVGLGGGVVIEELPPPAEQIDVVEIEPQVIAANRAIAGLRRVDPLADRRVRLIVDDARSVLRLGEERWDVVVSQPSHPWTAASSHLFTREFFARVAARLAPDGVFVQWIGLSFIDEPLLRTLVATLADVFPHVEVYVPPGAGAALFAAAARPLDPLATASLGLAAAPAGWAGLGVLTADDVALARWLDAEGSRRFAAGAPVSTDGRNLLKIRAPRILDRSLAGVELSELAPELDALPGAAVDLAYAARRLAPYPHLRARARRVAERIEAPAERLAALAAIDAAQGERRAAEQGLRRALELDPTSPAARATLVEFYEAELRAGRRVLAAEAVADPATAAVVAGWRAAEDRAALLALDPALAAVPPHHPLFDRALQLRIEARLDGPRALAQEAVALAEMLVGRLPAPAHHLLRARAGLAAGAPWVAAASLREATSTLARDPDPRLYRQALEVLDELRKVAGGEGPPLASLERQLGLVDRAS